MYSKAKIPLYLSIGDLMCTVALPSSRDDIKQLKKCAVCVFYLYWSDIFKTVFYLHVMNILKLSGKVGRI